MVRDLKCTLESVEFFPERGSVQPLAPPTSYQLEGRFFLYTF